MELLYFKLLHCPYCKEADNFIRELKEENPEYKNIGIKIIDEAKETELAASYDYYYVPTFFSGKRKLHEGASTKEKIRSVFNEALKENS